MAAPSPTGQMNKPVRSRPSDDLFSPTPFILRSFTHDDFLPGQRSTQLQASAMVGCCLVVASVGGVRSQLGQNDVFVTDDKIARGNTAELRMYRISFLIKMR